MRICPSCHERYDDAFAVCPRDGAPLPVDEADDRIGTVLLGQFELLEVCGKGAMGTVYRAWQTGMERQVAIKVLRPELLRDPTVVARFDREARAVAKLQHPNIVTFFLVGRTDDGLPFLAMEYVDGEALSEIAEHAGVLETARTLHIARQITSALSEAHAEGIVHRDLKPANILLSQRRRMPDFVKVLDFGIAKILGGEGDVREPMESRLTRTGAIFGTPHYISPEQASGGEVDHRADLYSLGVILYRLLTGRLPFEGAGLAVMLAHVSQAVVPPSRIIPGIDRALEALILRAMEKDPALRFQSAEEMADALEAAGAPRGGVRSDEALAATTELSPSTPTPQVISDEIPIQVASRDLPLVSRELAVDPVPSRPVRKPSSTAPILPPPRSFGPLLLGLGAVGVLAVGSAWYVGRPPRPAAPAPAPVAAAVPSPSLPPPPSAAPTPRPTEPAAPVELRTITVGEEGYAIRAQVPRDPREDTDYTLVFDVLDPSGAPLAAATLGASLEDPDDVAREVEAQGAGPGHYLLAQNFALAGRYHVHVFPMPARKDLHIWFDLDVKDANGRMPEPRMARAAGHAHRAAPAPAPQPAGAAAEVHEGEGRSDPYHDPPAAAPPEAAPPPAPAPVQVQPPPPPQAAPVRRRRVKRPRPARPNPDGLE